MNSFVEDSLLKWNRSVIFRQVMKTCHLRYRILLFSRGYKTCSSLSLFCYAIFCVHSTFAITLKRKKKQVALLLVSCKCLVTVDVLWLFLAVHEKGLQCVIVVFPDHTHFLFVPLELLLLMKKTLVSMSMRCSCILIQNTCHD